MFGSTGEMVLTVITACLNTHMHAHTHTFPLRDGYQDCDCKVSQNGWKIEMSGVVVHVIYFFKG